MQYIRGIRDSFVNMEYGADWKIGHLFLPGLSTVVMKMQLLGLEEKLTTDHVVDVPIHKLRAGIRKGNIDLEYERKFTICFFHSIGSFIQLVVLGNVAIFYPPARVVVLFPVHEFYLLYQEGF